MPVGTGRVLGAANATSACKYITFNYTAALVTQKVFTAPIACRVVSIQGVTRVAGSGGACTLAFYKAASAVAVGSGTLLHSGTFNVAGTADTNQDLTLVPVDASLTLVPGDSIGYVLTGTATDAVGAITITVEPVA